MSPPDRIIHFTGIFSLQFPGWKINTLSSSASGVYNSLLLCSVKCRLNEETEGVLSVIYGISL